MSLHSAATIRDFKKESIHKIIDKLGWDSRDIKWSGTISVGACKIHIETDIELLSDLIPMAFAQYFVGEADKDISSKIRVIYDDADYLLKVPDEHSLLKIYSADNNDTIPDILVNWRHLDSDKFTFIQDRDNNIIYFLVRPGFEKSPHIFAPIFRIFYSKWTGGILLHAAAIGKDDFGILLCGHSGVGKSTLSSLCLLDNLDIVGDDTVSLDTDGTANPTYKSISLCPGFYNNIDAFPARKFCTHWFGKKDVLYFNKNVKMRQNLPIRAIFMTHSGTKTNIEPLGRNGGILKLAQYYIKGIYFEGLNVDKECVKNIQSLMKDIDFYKITLGPDAKANSELIKQLIKQKEVLCTN